jgi:hypothetical protein
VPTPSIDAKELTVIDRIVAVLGAIAAGATYWYTPAAVVKRFQHWQEVTAGFPIYMVSLGSGGVRELYSHKTFYETFFVSIKGYVQDNADTATKILRCWQDIRLALTTDMESAASGALASLCTQVRCREFPETDDGYLSLEGFGFFDIRVEVQITDTTGYI